MSEALLQAVRGLHVADPDLGVKPLLAKLREQQPDLAAGNKEVREALIALKAEGEAKAKAKAAAAAAAAAAVAAAAAAAAAATAAAAAAAAAAPAAADAAAPPAADEGDAPPNAALSLACIGCFRLPSDMDDGREKHPICDMCRDEKLPTTYQCGKHCPANPGAWELHGVFHKKVRKQRKRREDGGAMQQRNREVAEEQARAAAQTGDKYDELLAEGTRHMSKQDYRRAAKANREAIALRPDEACGYFNLGNALAYSGHRVEAAQRCLEAKDRCPVGSDLWARSTASAFEMLRLEECDEMAKPGWWNDEGLMALSARVVRAGPNMSAANNMRAVVLSGQCLAWEEGPRSATELKEAAAHFERTAALCAAPAQKAMLAVNADWCRSQAEAR